MTRRNPTTKPGVGENLDSTWPYFADDTPDYVLSALHRLDEKEQAIEHVREGKDKPSPGFEKTEGGILADYIISLQRRIADLLEPLKFDYTPGRPMLIMKLGSEQRGWIPNRGHFDMMQKQLKGAGIDKQYNIILYHFGVHTEVIGASTVDLQTGDKTAKEEEPEVGERPGDDDCD